MQLLMVHRENGFTYHECGHPHCEFVWKVEIENSFDARINLQDYNTKGLVGRMFRQVRRDAIAECAEVAVDHEAEAKIVESILKLK